MDSDNNFPFPLRLINILNRKIDDVIPVLQNNYSLNRLMAAVRQDK